MSENSDYKNIWEILRAELIKKTDELAQSAMSTFDAENLKNYSFEVIESPRFLSEMAHARSSQDILWLMRDIELRELLYLKHAEKCKKYRESKTEEG